MNKSEFTLYSIYFILFMFLLLWISPSEAKINNQKQLPNLIIVEEEKIITNFKTVTIIDYKEEVYQAKEITKKVIGQKKVGTNEFKRIKYLGRYVYDSKQSNTLNNEYVYIDSYSYNHCDNECINKTMFIYDKYLVEENTKIVPIVIEELVFVSKEHLVPIERQEIIEESFLTKVPVYKIEENNLNNFLNYIFTLKNI